MATEFVFLQGKLKWVRTNTPDQYGNWKCTLYPNDDSHKKILALKERGLKNVLAKDEDGYYMRFTRPTSKTIRGKVQGFAPPEILQPDGSPLKDVLVGNGSDGTVKLEVYKYGGGTSKIQPGIAARLLSIRVDNLVPFTLNRDFEEDQERAARGLQEQPEQLF